LFISAFILFLVQPIVGKIILPKLGGTPQVWNTCMVFFQTMLLAGYAYTHNASTRLTLRQQLMAHAGLLLIPLIVLLPYPFSFGGQLAHESQDSIWGFVPALGSNPIPSTLTVLFLYVALPFVVVSTSAPLLQKWFAHSGHEAARDPYFLYSASNAGSLLSLILYPIAIEPYISLRNQAWMYAIGYLCLIVFVMVCACLVWNSKELQAAPVKTPTLPPPSEPVPPPPAAAAPSTGIQTGAPPTTPATSAAIKPGLPGKTPVRRVAISKEPTAAMSDEVTAWRRLRWVFLAFVPSSLMLGITTHITTDLSPIPLFWLVPLTLYIGSFILVFARWPVVWTEEPHRIMVIIQPFCVAGMVLADVLSLASSPTGIGAAIILHVLGFFTTTMVCHGELAKDRPATKHLTEFYLLMSVGGMLGGVFNGLIAPVVFKRLLEFPLGIFAAALARPKMSDYGLLDSWFASLLEGQPERPVAPAKGGGHQKSAKAQPHHAPQIQNVGATESLVGTLDWVWPIGILILSAILYYTVNTPWQMLTYVVWFGIPLALSCFCMARPIRFGLSIGAILLMHQFSTPSTLFSDRSYFGAISVTRGEVLKELDDTTKKAFSYNSLVHGSTLHGQNFLLPEAKLRGNPREDWSRLATTYYHRDGPAGRVMEQFNWWPKSAPNTYHADARMPASIIGNLAGDLGSGYLPLFATMVTLQSEPPYATVGLGTGTMASYGRPYQHVHFYEIDDLIFSLSLQMPTNRIEDFKQYDEFCKGSSKTTYFNYLERALDRGSNVQVLMGDARLRMNLPYKNHYTSRTRLLDLEARKKDGKLTPEESAELTELVHNPGGGPMGFYHMMVVDAFSSDAIPAHLLTEQAFLMYFDRLAPKGILCVHTSNKFADLVKVVAAISGKLGYYCERGHDSYEDRNEGHTTSEWVLVARKQDDLKNVITDDAFRARYENNVRSKSKRKDASVPTYWDRPTYDMRYCWTDDYYNLLSVVRFFRPSRGDD
jgi:hypothetical protein